MPWRCPACSMRIGHRPDEEVPRPGVIYRCPICKLELTLNDATKRLDAAPMTDQLPRSSDNS